MRIEKVIRYLINELVNHPGYAEYVSRNHKIEVVLLDDDLYHFYVNGREVKLVYNELAFEDQLKLVLENNI